MKIKIIWVGDNQPKWVQEACHDYLKRLKPRLKIETKEIPLGPRVKSKSTQQVIEEEGELILKHIEKNDFVVALDVQGKSQKSEQFAKNLRNWIEANNNLIFIIGSPEGLADNCRNRADYLLSLSALTFPHTIARVVLIEQIYRACCIWQNHPYHK